MTRSFAAVVVSLIVWKCGSANWIVVAPFAYYDSDPRAGDIYETHYFKPKASPIWRPPIPSDYDSSAHSWSHSTFFYPSVSGRLTGEPYLRIHWVRMLAEFTAMLVVISLGMFHHKWQHTGKFATEPIMSND